MKPKQLLVLFIPTILFLFILTGCSSEEEASMESAEEDTEYEESDVSEDDETYEDTESDEGIIDIGKRCKKHRYRLVTGEINYCIFSKKLGKNEPDELELDDITDEVRSAFGYEVSIDFYDIEFYNFPVWTVEISDRNSDGRYLHTFGKAKVSIGPDGNGYVTLAGMDLEKTGSLTEEEFYARLEELGEPSTFSVEMNGEIYESAYEKAYNENAISEILNLELSIDIPEDFNVKKYNPNTFYLKGGKSVSLKISIFAQDGYLWVTGPWQTADCYDGSE